MASEMSKAWWYSRDQENYQGPFDSREKAVREGRNDLADGDPFWVAEGRRMKLQVPYFGDWFGEAFDDANADYADPDGDGFSGTWKDDAYNALCADLEAVAASWLSKHGYDQGWALDLAPTELIPSTPEYDALMDHIRGIELSEGGKQAIGEVGR